MFLVAQCRDIMILLNSDLGTQSRNLGFFYILLSYIWMKSMAQIHKQVVTWISILLWLGNQHCTFLMRIPLQTPQSLIFSVMLFLSGLYGAATTKWAEIALPVIKQTILYWKRTFKVPKDINTASLQWIIGSRVTAFFIMGEICLLVELH